MTFNKFMQQVKDGKFEVMFWVGVRHGRGTADGVADIASCGITVAEAIDAFRAISLKLSEVE